MKLMGGSCNLVVESFLRDVVSSEVLRVKLSDESSAMQVLEIYLSWRITLHYIPPSLITLQSKKGCHMKLIRRASIVSTWKQACDIISEWGMGTLFEIINLMKTCNTLYRVLHARVHFEWLFIEKLRKSVIYWS